MTSRFRHQIELDAPVERVVEVLLDPASHVGRYAAAGATRGEVVTLDVEDDGSVTLVSRRAEGGSLPAPIARLVRGAAQITQTERWSVPEPDGARLADWTVVTKGVPVDVTGTTELRPRAGGSVLVETGVITAHVPLLSGLIEKVAAEQAGAKLALEWAWLADQL